MKPKRPPSKCQYCGKERYLRMDLPIESSPERQKMLTIAYSYQFFKRLFNLLICDKILAICTQYVLFEMIRSHYSPSSPNDQYSILNEMSCKLNCCLTCQFF